MAFGTTRAVALAGVEGRVVTVEVNGVTGLPAYVVSGLPDAACAQAPDRVRAAVQHCGLRVQQRRWTINLSPAGLPKIGSAFDLAIAVALLAAEGELALPAVAGVAHLGELGLDGSVRGVPGVLPMVLAAAESGLTEVVVAQPNAREAALARAVQVHAVRTLDDVVELHRARAVGAPPPDLMPISDGGRRPAPPDLSDVVGQVEARQALELAAAGRHHLLLVGPPGAGKTMLAERLPGILPPLSEQEALEVTAIHSVLGVLPSAEVLLDRSPFVAPHHGTSMAAVLGGGSGRVRPGAISRAHRGVLFLDEAPEFRRDVLDGLRQPLEAGEVVIARGDRHVRLPAGFQLVMAANPCPCGHGHGKGRRCECTPLARRRYFAKLSGPLLDRIDVRVSLLPVTRASLSGAAGESSAVVLARVHQARQAQAERWADTPWQVNAEVPGAHLRERHRLPALVTRPLGQALDRGLLTLRGYDRCLRLAWTMADLGGLPRPGQDEVTRAITLRADTEVAA